MKSLWFCYDTELARDVVEHDEPCTFTDTNVLATIGTLATSSYVAIV